MDGLDSPRIYVSSNPWKSLCPFRAVSSTREEYLTAVEVLKANAPKVPENEKRAKAKLRNKFEQGHLDLISFLEANLPKVDNELAVSTKFPSPCVLPTLGPHKCLICPVVPIGNEKSMPF